MKSFHKTYSVAKDERMDEQMNAYEAAKKLYSISDEIEQLNNKMRKAQHVDERNRIEKRIDSLEVEFFNVKHRMEKVKIITI